MKSAFKSLQIFLLLCGVFGADELKSVSVMEGDSVTLHNDLTQIKKFSLLEWKFGDSVIARTNGKNISYPSPTEIFRDRLQLDETGSLTIKNMKARLSGLYELQISHSAGTSGSKFNVTVYESPSIAGQAEVKSLSVKEGYPVTLQTDVTQLYGDELIVWRFGDEGKLIAKADMEAKSSPLYDTDERFRGDHQTGSLTITNTRTTDSGFYTVKISSKKQTSYKRFSVAVSEPDLSPGVSPGVSPGAVAGIVVLILAAAAAVVIYHRRKISELRKQTLRTVIMTAGKPVHLSTGRPKIETDDEIEWRFGAEKTLIAEIREGTVRYDVPDERFRDRLKLNDQTGDLTILNSADEHAGRYDLIILNSAAKHAGCYNLKIRSSKGDTIKTYIVIKDEERGKSLDVKRVNESAVNDPLLVVSDGVNEQEGMSSL